MSDIIIRYLHFIGIMGLTTSLFTEYFMLSMEVTITKIKRISIIDTYYGISALLVLATGLLQWFVIGKPATFYNTNYIFHIKLTLFILLVILSIYPTIYFLKHRKSDKDVVRLPKLVYILVRIELFILFLIPLLAVLMAKGLGMS